LKKKYKYVTANSLEKGGPKPQGTQKSSKIRITPEYFKTDSNRHKGFIYYVFLNKNPLIYIELFFKLTKSRSTLGSMQMHYDAFGGNSPASGNQRNCEHRLAKRKQCQTFAIVANCQDWIFWAIFRGLFFLQRLSIFTSSILRKTVKN